MNLYLDTSAWVKLYVEEDGSAAVRSLVEGAELSGISRVAYPEARAALARRHREGALTETELRAAVAAVDRDLERMLVVEVTPTLTTAAGNLAESHRLRGFDALHLASALELRRLLGGELCFACYDDRLRAGALELGLRLPDGGGTPQ